jgi:hypothetical protein
MRPGVKREHTGESIGFRVEPPGNGRLCPEGLAPSPPLGIMAASPIPFGGEGRDEGSPPCPDRSGTSPHLTSPRHEGWVFAGILGGERDQATPAPARCLIRSLADITANVSLHGGKPNPWSIRLIFSSEVRMPKARPPLPRWASWQRHRFPSGERVGVRGRHLAQTGPGLPLT